MNGIVAGIGAALIASIYWSIAADTAPRRGLVLGARPLLLPVVAAGCAIAGADANASAAAIAAAAGVIVAAWSDTRTGAIFDPLTAALLIVSLTLATLDGGAVHALAGAIAVGAALFALHALTGGRGLGLGDVKLGAAIGAAFGIGAGFIAIGLAFVFGAAYGTWLLATKRAGRTSAIRFGPFIAAGTIAALVLPNGVHP